MATERYDKRIDRPEDIDYFNRYAEIILPKVKGKVLDIGCGQGWLTKLIAQQPEVTSVTAIDKLTEQPEENQDHKIHYIKGNLPKAIPTVSYDTIVSTEFIEHITEQDFRTLLEKINLKPEGRFLGSTPNVAQHSGNPYHLREYHNGEFVDLLDEYGFICEYENPLPYLLVWEAWKE